MVADSLGMITSVINLYKAYFNLNIMIQYKYLSINKRKQFIIHLLNLLMLKKARFHWLINIMIHKLYILYNYKYFYLFFIKQILII